MASESYAVTRATFCPNVLVVDGRNLYKLSEASAKHFTAQLMLTVAGPPARTTVVHFPWGHVFREPSARYMARYGERY